METGSLCQLAQVHMAATLLTLLFGLLDNIDPELKHKQGNKQHLQMATLPWGCKGFHKNDWNQELISPLSAVAFYF